MNKQIKWIKLNQVVQIRLQGAWQSKIRINGYDEDFVVLLRGLFYIVECDSVYMIYVKVWWRFMNEELCCEICLWFWMFVLNFIVDSLCLVWFKVENGNNVVVWWFVFFLGKRERGVEMAFFVVFSREKGGLFVRGFFVGLFVVFTQKIGV